MMEDESIEEILSALKSPSANDGVEKLMAELEELPRSVSSTPVKTTPNKDDALGQILTEIGTTKPTPGQKQQIHNFPVEKPKENTFPEELEKIGNDLKRQKTEQAQNWLKKLDPLSSEGIWFKEFAKHYDSELKAALDYLQ